MNKPKYEYTLEANERLRSDINRLVPDVYENSSVMFGYERKWDEKGKWIADMLTVYRKGAWPNIKRTTMSPEKFEIMSDKGKKDFIGFLVKEVG